MKTKNLFEKGEHQLSQYKVQFAEWQNSHWSGTGYWLKIVVTNKRMVFVLDTPQHAINMRTIALADITKAWNISMGRRDGMMLQLRSGKKLYMLVDWSQGRMLTKDVNDLLIPPLKPRISPRQRSMN